MIGSIGVTFVNLNPEFQRLRNTVSDVVEGVEILPILPNRLDDSLEEGWQNVIARRPELKEVLFAFYDCEDAILEMRYQKFSKSKFHKQFQRYKDELSIILDYFSKNEEDLKTILSDVPVGENFSLFLEKVGIWKSVIEKKLSSSQYDDIMVGGDDDESQSELDMKFKKLNTDKKNLEKMLMTVQKERRHENKRLDGAITKNSQEIDSFQMNLDQQNKMFLEKYNEREIRCVNEYQSMKERLKTEILEFRKELLELKKKNNMIEKNTRLVVKNKERAVNNSIKKYDKFMFEHTEELANLKRDFETDSKRIAFLRKEIEIFRKEKELAKAEKDRMAEKFRGYLRKVHSIVLLKIVIKNVIAREKASLGGGKKKDGKKKGKNKKKKGKKNKK